jgi:Protein of unknown function (DUF4019)
MRILVTFIALATFIGAAPQGSGADTPAETAETAALTWLALVDAGNYPESWNTAAALFKNAVPQSQWVSTVAATRGALGAVKIRQVASSQSMHSLPGAPDGEYVVIRFTTSFEQKAAATETVTPMKDPHGHWRVSGYYIR